MKISIFRKTERIWKKIKASGSGQMRGEQIDVITSLGVSYHDYVDMKISIFRESGKRLEKIKSVGQVKGEGEGN